MNKKRIAIILLCIGSILICLSIILSIISTLNKDIIGGADFPTFILVLMRENNGVYFYLALCGMISLITSAIIGLKAKKNHTDKF